MCDLGRIRSLGAIPVMADLLMRQCDKIRHNPGPLGRLIVNIARGRNHAGDVFRAFARFSWSGIRMSKLIRAHIEAVILALRMLLTASLARAQTIITTVAGDGAVSFSGDGGAASNAALNYPWGLVMGPTGMIYIADMENFRIRRVARGASFPPSPAPAFLDSPAMEDRRRPLCSAMSLASRWMRAGICTLATGATSESAK